MLINKKGVALKVSIIVILSVFFSIIPSMETKASVENQSNFEWMIDETQAGENTEIQDKHNRKMEKIMNKVERLMDKLQGYYLEKSLIEDSAQGHINPKDKELIKKLENKISKVKKELESLDVKDITREEALEFHEQATEGLSSNDIGNGEDINISPFNLSPQPDTRYTKFSARTFSLYSNGVNYDIGLMYATPTNTKSYLSRSAANVSLYTTKAHIFNSAMKVLTVYGEKLIGAAISPMGAIVSWSPYELFTVSPTQQITNNKLNIQYGIANRQCFAYVKKASQPNDQYQLTLRTNSVETKYIATAYGYDQNGTTRTYSSGDWKTIISKSSVYGNINAPLRAYLEQGGIRHDLVESVRFTGHGGEYHRVSLRNPIAPNMIFD